MKTVLCTVVLSTLSALSFAEATQFEVPAGTLTRANVVAQIGSPSPVAFLGDAAVFTTPNMTQLTRAQVKAETVADRALRRGYGESSAHLHFAAGPGTGPSNAEVVGDMRQARSSRHFGDANRDDFNLRSN